MEMSTSISYDVTHAGQTAIFFSCVERMVKELDKRRLCIDRSHPYLNWRTHYFPYKGYNLSIKQIYSKISGEHISEFKTNKAARYFDKIGIGYKDLWEEPNSMDIEKKSNPPLFFSDQS